VVEESITFVGLDVHKETIAVALAEGGQRGEVREYGEITNTPAAVKTRAFSHDLRARSLDDPLVTSRCLIASGPLTAPTTAVEGLERFQHACPALSPLRILRIDGWRRLATGRTSSAASSFDAQS